MAAVVSSDSLLAAAPQGVRIAANNIRRGMKVNRAFSKSALQQCKAVLLPCLLSISLVCGGDVFAATALAAPGSRQLAMTTGAGPAYSVVKLGPASISCLNSSGQVAFTISQTSLAAYFYSGGQFQNLGALGGPYTSTNAINDYGRVVGSSDLAGRGSSTPLPRIPMSLTPSFSQINCNRPSIKSKGQLEGNAIAAGRSGGNTYHAFLWTPTKGMVDLGTLYGGDSVGTGINNAEEVIGLSDSTTNPPFFVQGFYWSAATGMIEAGGASGVVTNPIAINDAGQVVGAAVDGLGPNYAFLWTKAGGMVKLGSLEYESVAYATAINNKGQVVGISKDGFFRVRVFSWTQAGGMIDLGYVPDIYNLLIYNPQVNNLGQVLLPSSIWTSAGGKVNIGSLGGGNTTTAAINNLGQVVGSANDIFGQTRAFVWTKASGMVDLNTPGLPVDTPLQTATAIADNGSILATSSGGITYLLVPNTRRITSPPSESFFQKSPFQRLTPGMLVFP